MEWNNKYLIGSVVVLVVLVIFYFTPLFQYSTWNTESIVVGQTGRKESYKVHKAHDSDKKKAAALMKEINDRNQTLFTHIREKYVDSPTVIGPNPDKEGRIDIVPVSKFYEDLTNLAATDGGQTMNEYLQDRIQQLVTNYSPARMYEISPLNAGDATSYTEEKRTLVLCLRHKTPNADGIYELHDINTMMFVVLHELTHMANKYWQHKPDFWILFKFFLVNAAESGVYNPVDYGRHPINYCGLDLTYNPYFDIAV
jgi:hypothetical protein